ncbi:hypothetical protein G9A89_009874 [Geosiphon pyriformis]|nr:hypothetical protein G9A89_009874 [Geosiphon pyriformis]
MPPTNFVNVFNTDNYETCSIDSLSTSSSLDPLEAAREENTFDQFVFVNGRRYLAGDETIVTSSPNDQIEAARKYNQHYFLKLIWGGKFSAPIQKKMENISTAILDIGTGTGIWVLDNSKKYPLSSTIGIDISPTFPDKDRKPENAHFLISNILHGIPFPADTFDFVHQRFLFDSIKEREWSQTALAEIVRVIKPNGWFEIEDNHKFEIYNAGPILSEFRDAMFQYFKRNGIGQYSAESVQKYLSIGHNLYDFHSKTKDIHLGSWAGKIGELMLEDLILGLSGLIAVLPSIMGISPTEYFAKLESIRTETNLCYLAKKNILASFSKENVHNVRYLKGRNDNSIKFVSEKCDSLSVYLCKIHSLLL